MSPLLAGTSPNTCKEPLRHPREDHPRQSEGLRGCEEASQQASRFSTCCFVAISGPPSVGQQPVTPMTQVSPHGYGQSYPFSYGSPYYGYPGAGYFADAQGQYYPVSPYGYSPYAYGGSPQYASGTSSTVDAAGSPNDSQGYYGYYSPYPAQYWGFSGQTVQQPMWYAPAYSPPAATTVQEDRCATPTPTGHTTIVESSMESQ